MNNVNTVSKVEFLFNNIFYAVLAFISFKHNLLKSIDGITQGEAMVYLMMLVSICVLTGIIFCWKNRRNNLSTFANVLFPYGLCTLILYYKIFPVFCTIVVILSLVLSAFYFYSILSRAVPNPRYKERIIFARIIHCFKGAKTLSAVCMSVLVFVLTLNMLFGGTLINPKTSPTIPTGDYEEYENVSIECLYSFDKDVWSGLSSKEKTTVLQEAANLQAVILGIDHELNVKLQALTEGHYGSYSDANHTILINIDLLDHPLTILQTVFHESYHAYQYRLCEAYDAMEEEFQNLELFHDIRYYKQEFNNYKSSVADFDEYYSQKCESNAREYAENNIEAVKKLLSNKQETQPTTTKPE